MKKRLFIICAIIYTLSVCIYAKKPLDHDAFDSWQKLVNYSISNNGKWEVYAVEPQEGDAVLYFHNNKTNKDLVIERGYNPVFSADSKWGFALIKPLFTDSRKARIEKKKDLDLPHDSLAIVNLEKGTVEKIANVKSFKIGEKGGDWIAYQSIDTIYAKKSDLSDKDSGKPLVLRKYDGKIKKVIHWVDSYNISNSGTRIAMTIKKPETDSLATNGLGVILLPDTAFYLIDREKKFYGSPVFDEKGEKLAYTAGNDSSKSGTKRLQLYLSHMSSIMETPKEYDVVIPGLKGKNLRRPDISDPKNGKLLQEWERRMQASRSDSLFINQYAHPEFSYNGDRLIIGVAPYIAPDDTTIIDFERADLDIWRWDSPRTPPQEKANLSELKEKSVPVVIDIATDKWTLPTRNMEATVWAPNRWDSNWAMICDPSDNMVETQWNYLAKENISLYNLETEETRFVGTTEQENSMLSPSDRFVLWYESRQFYTYNISTGDTVCISRKIPFPIWEEEDDRPMEKQAYGLMGWSEDDKYVLIYDKYDVWVLDPTGVKEPFSLTNGEGRKKNLQFRYIKTDKEERYFKPGMTMLFNVFHFGTKERGLATLKYEEKASNPKIRLLEGATFTQIRKAKDADTYSWQRASFEIMPNIWVSTSLDFNKAIQLTDANPQSRDYSWGTAQLFKWNAYDGKPSEGVLYLPEDFTPEQEYPMLVVFYETGSEYLFHHYNMEPSWSWINYPFYVSRGYVVFVPDIHYTTGLPGESAYNYVCSGVDAVCDVYPNIDRKRIGIDGQSWGGYQTAYLVTRTNMFACAGSGAPVSNMTSAFGGIRWESGSSRQAQYEQGQSRIGQSLWEAPELYISNSPLFHADKCHTPLLIMHNDADGAVPWYQGIELFMALRRLQRPVWMLTYNGEAHNIKERRNRKDITIRLQQFFDHYLKGDPMPRWMKEGINPLRKGQEMGY